MLRISIASVEIILSPWWNQFMYGTSTYAKPFMYCLSIALEGLTLEDSNDSLLIFVGAVLQWAVVTTAGYKVLELKAMG